MSKYSENKTQFHDAELLCLALQDMGFTIAQIERNTNPQLMYDFCGRVTTYLDASGDKAEIIIRRKHVDSVLSGSSSNDLGFRKDTKTGLYGAIISEYDSHYANKAWLTRLAVSYAKHGIMRQAASKGMRLASTTQKNGKITLQYLGV